MMMMFNFSEQPAKQHIRGSTSRCYHRHCTLSMEMCLFFLLIASPTTSSSLTGDAARLFAAAADHHIPVCGGTLEGHLKSIHCLLPKESHVRKTLLSAFQNSMG